MDMKSKTITYTAMISLCRLHIWFSLVHAPLSLYGSVLGKNKKKRLQKFARASMTHLQIVQFRSDLVQS